MSWKRLKACDARMEDDHDRMDAERADRLSDLPDFVLHQILSLLPTFDVVRMSLLSKRWRHMWRYLPALYFSDSNLTASDASRPRNFCKRVGMSLRRRKADVLAAKNTEILSFKLDMKYSWKWSSVEGWLNLVSKCKLKELDVSFSLRTTRYYRLPHDLLRVKSLTRLKLVHVNVSGLGSISLPSLKSLYLEKVWLKDQDLHNLISGSPCLEKLWICHCSALWESEIRSFSLKYLEIYQRGTSVHRVEATNLESFVCRGFSIPVEDWDLSLCEALRHLSFVNTPFDEKWLEALTLRLLLLESLTLQNCGEWDPKHFKIQSRSLKHFIFEQNKDAVATLNCPNLVYFSCEGEYQPNFVSMNPKNLLEAKISFNTPCSRDMDYYVSLLGFFSNLNCSKRLILEVESEEDLLFPESVRMNFDPPLPNLKNMMVRIRKPLTTSPDLMEALNWASPSIQTLSITAKCL